MAVTKLWEVRNRLDHVIDYATNKSKTENPNYSEEELQALGDVLAYAKDEEKTEKQFYVTGINCSAQQARNEFVSVKRNYDKLDGVQAYHGYMSFKQDEVTPELAHQIGIAFASKVWGERFQVVVTTHLNSRCLHNHFVINSISFVDGKRLQNQEKAWFIFRQVADELCKEYGLSVIEKPERNRDPYYLTMQNKAGMPTRYNLVRAAVDEAIAHSRTLGEFQQHLSAMGYKYNLSPNRRYWTVTPNEDGRPIRLYRLGDDYTNRRIRDRIEENAKNKTFLKGFTGYTPPPYHPQYDIRRVKGSLYNLYLYYCYRLGYFDKPEERQTPHKLHYLLRKDLMKVEKYSEEARLLGKHHIETTEQLVSYKESCEKEMEDLTTERKHLRNNERHKGISEVERSEIKDKISSISQRLSQLRKEISLCEDIAARSQELEERVEQIRTDDERAPKQKEEKSYEQFK